MIMPKQHTFISVSLTRYYMPFLRSVDWKAYLLSLEETRKLELCQFCFMAIKALHGKVSSYIFFRLLVVVFSLVSRKVVVAARSTSIAVKKSNNNKKKIIIKYCPSQTNFMKRKKGNFPFPSHIQIHDTCKNNTNFSLSFYSTSECILSVVGKQAASPTIAPTAPPTKASPPLSYWCINKLPFALKSS